jgi:hypothetical protein
MELKPEPDSRGFSAALTVPFTDLSMTQVLGTATLTGSGSETVFGRTSPLEPGTFNTQITSLDLLGAFNGIPLAVTQDPSNASTGQTTITPLGEQFVITSFFDIFVDIQLSTSPPLMTTRGPLVAVLEPVPEPTGLALMVLSLPWRYFAARAPHFAGADGRDPSAIRRIPPAHCTARQGETFHRHGSTTIRAGSTHS